MITLENISSHELIGTKIKICNSTNPQIIGLSGTIVDESKSTFVINTRNQFKIIPKKHTTWKFYADGQEMTLYGSLLEKRSFDRLEAKT